MSAILVEYINLPGSIYFFRRIIFYSINKTQLLENGDKEVQLISVSQVWGGATETFRDIKGHLGTFKGQF